MEKIVSLNTTIQIYYIPVNNFAPIKDEKLKNKKPIKEDG